MAWVLRYEIAINFFCNYNFYMGLYVNPGNENFTAAIRSEIYVDKTMLLSELNRRLGTEDRFLAVSRPRRFGKTMAENMIAAYYSKGCDSRELFETLEISGEQSFSKHLNKYNMLYLDINAFWSENKNAAFSAMKKEVLREFKFEFPDTDFSDVYTVENAIRRVYEQTRIPFVLVLDEYDTIFRTAECSSIENDYLSFLNSMFKGAAMTSCITLAYITGILPIIREKAQSKLNNFDEITFLAPGRFAKFTGFTGDEVKELCCEYHMDYEECRSWYDGYSVRGEELYAPRSVAKAMSEGEYKSYWSQTSTFRVVKDIIALNFSNMKTDVEKLVSGFSVPVNIMKFENTPSRIFSRDDAFTYLCHLGYLSYDSQSGTCRIPNREVRMEWVNAIEDDPDYSVLYRMIQDSKEALQAAWDGNGPRLAEVLGRAHERLTSPLSYNNEQSFQSAIRLAFFYADSYYTVISEYPSGKGYADIAFIPYKPNIPAMVVELKVRGTADTALDQIRAKRYFAGLEKYAGNILLVGVSYDRETKKHECVMERA